MFCLNLLVVPGAVVVAIVVVGDGVVVTKV